METPRGRIERLVAEGRIPRMAVARAERLWHERLHAGVRMPNGETVQITLDDLFHVLVDDRIWRHPERIATALVHVVEIRRAHSGRRQALSQWTEGSSVQFAIIILTGESRLWSLHIVDERRAQRYARGGGEVLWQRSQQP